MSYRTPKWRLDELKYLLYEIDQAYVWAERYKDRIMKHYLKLLRDLITARLKHLEEEAKLIEDNNDSRA